MRTPCVHRRLSSALYPLPYSLASAAAYFFPASVQQFYNEQLEALFTQARRVMLTQGATAFHPPHASRRPSRIPRHGLTGPPLSTLRVHTPSSWLGEMLITFRPQASPGN